MHSPPLTTDLPHVADGRLLTICRGNKHGPPGIQRLSLRLQKLLTPWRSVVATLLYLYIARNFAKLVGLESPEPLANLYSRPYFRATWVTTALDAGFWTAMRIRRKWLRDLASFVFSLYYLIAAEHADEKVRKVRATLTVDHLRVSWNKSTTPYLAFFSRLLSKKTMKYPPRAVRIPRPRSSAYTEPVSAWLYFDGPLSTLRQHTRVVLDVPGGGFVAMTPRNHEEKLSTWAGKTGLPVLSLDYKKAPEYPYPYALNECYDVYHMIVESRGRCIGLEGNVVPQIVVTGDSAGGNLATGMTLMILQAGGTDSRRWQGEQTLPTPTGLILTYPGLDMNIGNWMTDEQMSLIKERRVRKTNKNILRRKSEDYYKLDPTTPHASDDEGDSYFPETEEGIVASPSQENADKPHLWTRPSPQAGRINQSDAVAKQEAAIRRNSSSKTHPSPLKTRLAMSSMISYFNDRILTPEMMRAMIILYVGPHNRPDFSTDYLLSPLLAPESLLARFPPTFFMTGERDPLVDDTVIFAGRIRQAKMARFRERQDLGLERGDREFEEREHVRVSLLPGLSHGFFQFVSVFPEAQGLLERMGRWIEEMFADADARALIASASSSRIRLRDDRLQNARRNRGATRSGVVTPGGSQRHHRRHLTAESSGDEDRPLEMSSIRPGPSTPSSEGPPSPTATRRASALRPLTLTTASPSGKGSVDADVDLERGVGEKRARVKRNYSLATLASEEDLLGRRMHGLAGGLMGDGEGVGENES